LHTSSVHVYGFYYSMINDPVNDPTVLNEHRPPKSIKEAPDPNPDANPNPIPN